MTASTPTAEQAASRTKIIASFVVKGLIVSLIFMGFYLLAAGR